jgi:hypothetical protein
MSILNFVSLKKLLRQYSHCMNNNQTIVLDYDKHKDTIQKLSKFWSA